MSSFGDGTPSAVNAYPEILSTKFFITMNKMFPETRIKIHFVQLSALRLTSLVAHAALKAKWQHLIFWIPATSKPLAFPQRER